MSTSETGASSVIWTSDIINSPGESMKKEKYSEFFKASIISCIASSLYSKAHHNDNRTKHRISGVCRNVDYLRLRKIRIR